MSPRISLALTLHNHQPVGNFGWVIAETHDRAYLPMVEALERHPRVRVALHYSGPLLGWLRAERPDFVARLARLAERGQVEIVGGGWYEPVLAALPERDRVGQLVRMADELESTFGPRPRGAWLAERVWEPDLPTALVSAGYDWTVLDDAHFRAAAIPEDDLWGSYTTDDQGKVLTVFGTEQGLRYRIPFAEVDDVIGYLRDHASDDGERLGTMGDDGEKFGAWPTTWEHCWGGGRWVERFFEALDANAEWLSTVTPSDWIGGHRPVGRVYLPTGSYAEMGEWALPADEALAFGSTLRRARAEGRPEARWLRGAIWRNFQIRYREINDIHKQMLTTSDLVEAVPPGALGDVARDHLYAGQSNDCYWHGLFGGIYLPDLRVAALARLIAAEDLVTGPAAPSAIRRDVDLDGREEVVLSGPGQFVTVKLEEGGGISRWDLRAAGHPLAAVMRRRPEAYHETLRLHELAKAGHGVQPGEPGDGEREPTDGERHPTAADGAAAPASIHDIVRVKQEGLLEHLRYDAYERRSALVRILPADTTPATAAAGTTEELADLRDGTWALDGLDAGRVVLRRAGNVRVAGGSAPIEARKTIEIGGGRLDPSLTVELEIRHRGEPDSPPIDALLGIEWSTMLLGGGHNPAAWHEVDGRRIAHDEAAEVAGVSRLVAANEQLGVTVETTIDRPVEAWIAPIQTVSNSEAGFELVYQGSATLLIEPLRLGPGERLTIRIGQQLAIGGERFGGGPVDGVRAGTRPAAAPVEVESGRR
ncbi:MAG TPA: alpha-amylase/4-alpha-glucanotransferase domain-containing protein [Candidatus Limnocylindrales bacterium]|nr:alpha-amylase/4-alpha-glucanotransferase domain-containing protein [Candidatus Limnocylindrales bacterium]